MATLPSEAAERGIGLFKAGNTEEAMPHLRQAIENEPERSDLHMYLGLCWAKREKWVDAEREFNKAGDLDGTSAEAPYFAGLAMVKQGRLREAHGSFHVACLNNPNHAKAKQAWEQTKQAAAVVTTDRSSAAMPGGIGNMDFSSLDSVDLGRPKSTDPLAGALADYKQQQGGGGGGKSSGSGKKAGCGAGLMALALCALAVAWALMVVC